MLTKLSIRQSRCCKILITVSIFAVLYIGYGYHLSTTTHEVLLSALNSYYYVENNPYSDIISDEQYNRLIPNKYADYNKANTHNEIYCQKPLVLHWFVGAIVWSQYDYAYYQNDEEIAHLSNVTVRFTYKKQGGLWRIVDCHTSPSLTGA